MNSKKRGSESQQTGNEPPINESRMGRPLIDIDRQMFERLCGIMCTQKEISEVLNVDEDTITNWSKRTYGVTFSEVYKSLTAGAKASVRRAQYRLAVEELNPTMLIWLGKQFLGQKDSPIEIETYELEFVKNVSEPESKEPQSE